MSISAALDPAPALFSRDLDLAARFMGVPLRLVFAGVLPAASDFRGRPRPRFIGEGASWSFSGTVVVLVRVTFFSEGDMVFSPSLSGSACTVTLMRHGLAPPIRGVFMTMDFAGEAISNSCVLASLFCLLGEVVRGVCCGFRVDVMVLS